MGKEGIKNTLAAGLVIAGLSTGLEAKEGDVDYQKEKAQISTETQSRAQRLLLQCDGADRRGVVDPKKKDGKISGRERFCAKKVNIAENKRELAKEKRELAERKAQLKLDRDQLKQMDLEIAQIDKKGAESKARLAKLIQERKELEADTTRLKNELAENLAILKKQVSKK